MPLLGRVDLPSSKRLVLGTFKGKIELKKYSMEEYDIMPSAQHQQLYELWKKAGLIKGKKNPEAVGIQRLE